MENLINALSYLCLGLGCLYLAIIFKNIYKNIKLYE